MVCDCTIPWRNQKNIKEILSLKKQSSVLVLFRVVGKKHPDSGNLKGERLHVAHNSWLQTVIVGKSRQQRLKQLVTLQPGQEQRTVPNAHLLFPLLNFHDLLPRGWGYPQWTDSPTSTHWKNSLTGISTGQPNLDNCSWKPPHCAKSTVKAVTHGNSCYKARTRSYDLWPVLTSPLSSS